MAQLAPRDRLAASVGLYAMAAQITGFAAPLAVGVLTGWAESQRAGLALAVPLILGGALLQRRAGRAAMTLTRFSSAQFSTADRLAGFMDTCAAIEAVDVTLPPDTPPQ